MPQTELMQINRNTKLKFEAALFRRPKLALEPTGHLFGLEGIKPFALFAP